MRKMLNENFILFISLSISSRGLLPSNAQHFHVEFEEFHMCDTLSCVSSYGRVRRKWNLTISNELVEKEWRQSAQKRDVMWNIQTRLNNFIISFHSHFILCLNCLDKVKILWITKKNSHQSKQREISNSFQSFMNACDAILEEKWNKHSFC